MSKVGIIYKFTILVKYRLFNNRIFYIGQHWDKRSVENFLSSKSNYWGGGTIWNRYLELLKTRYPKSWRNLIKREVLFSSETISLAGLNKLEAYFIQKNKSLFVDKLGGVNIVSGAPLEINPATSDIVKRKISCALKGRIFSEQHIERLKLYWNSERLSGEKNPNYGNHWNKEQRQKQREKMLGRYEGENNPNYGRRWTSDKRSKMSERVREGYKNGTLINPMTGKVRITNGIINTIILKDDPLPEGFWYGMKPRKK